MIKVLHVIPTLNFGGISSVITNWIKANDENKYIFDVLAFNDGPVRSIVELNGGQVFLVRTIKDNPISYFKNLINIIKGGNYDAVHVHNSFKNGIALAVARLLGVKIRICHSHTTGLEDKSLKLLFPFLKYIAISNSTKLIACGERAGEFLYKKRKYEVINNAVDIEKFLKIDVNRRNACRFGLPENKVIIGHLGRFSDVKNHSFILRLAKQLDCRFHIVMMGDGPLKQEIKENIKQNELEEKITVLDSTNLVAEYLNCLDFFILPSKFEGVSLALLEAQASSLNCFVSDNVPKDNDIGLELINFLPIDDPMLWANKIIHYKETGSLEPSAIEEAFFRNGFSIKYLKTRLNELYC